MQGDEYEKASEVLRTEILTRISARAKSPKQTGPLMFYEDVDKV